MAKSKLYISCKGPADAAMRTLLFPITVEVTQQEDTHWRSSRFS